MWFATATRTTAGNRTRPASAACRAERYRRECNAIANLGYGDIRHCAPVFHGDTLFAESEVLDKRESASRDRVGIVTTELRAYTQRDELVLSLERTPMVLKRSHAEPSPARPTGWPEGVGTQPEDLE